MRLSNGPKLVRRTAYGVLAASVSFTISQAIGCGGTPPPQATSPESHPADGGSVETFAEVNPADVAELEKLQTGKVNNETKTPDEPKDECTPVGADFEKRARPKLKECYAKAKQKNPDLTGTVKLAIAIDTLGRIKSQKVIEKTLPDSVAQCMLKVVKATPLPEASKCPGKTLTIPITFPTPP